MAGDILVIGAGVAGMKASLMLASAGRKVFLVEKSSMIGGRVIRCEDIFPAMECATCMVSPMQQEVLRTGLIQVIANGHVVSVDGPRGDFSVRLAQRASSVDPQACIGCAECWGACPVEADNEFEEGLSRRKAISVPCAGALPNVPWIDRGVCLRWTGERDCSLCSEACVFAAIDYGDSDREILIKVSEIVLATGYDTGSSALETGGSAAVFSAPEFERYYASNGPTSGELVRKDGARPGSAAILVHAGGIGSHSPINTMYCLKFLHYLHEKLPEIRPLVLLDDSYCPDIVSDVHHFLWEGTGAEIILHSGPVRWEGSEGCARLFWKNAEGDRERDIDLLILGTPMLPSEGTREMIRLLGMESDVKGFALNPDPLLSSVGTSISGIFTAGCAGGPMSIAASVTSASAAVGRILSYNTGTAG
ncbi:MAG: CoB--CoM heterodisulfide reductase iron-sulfur subunit A family protein [Candidatus Fermentibacteraceae bacterium]|nr:CoB--CoM heterodisulfide reductase iron-sulfur subunit A family protein [Candidatus Fermentibacteraceae bacterium]MBN2608636.1 CoB--CoM heterodisulfide reductase iron-sulfur subunit A family protein [Candidatus Fermentibacteraceae bacterium]